MNVQEMDFLHLLLRKTVCDEDGGLVLGEEVTSVRKQRERRGSRSKDSEKI